MSTENLLSCDMCDYKIDEKSVLKTHMISIHIIQKAECNICKKEFRNEFRLRKHVKKMHSEKQIKEKHECEICWRKYFVEYHLICKHVEKCHPGELERLTLTCDICGEKYYSELQMRKHKQKFHSQPFVCSYKDCKRGFSLAASRKNHYLSYHKCDMKVR